MEAVRLQPRFFNAVSSQAFRWSKDLTSWKDRQVNLMQCRFLLPAPSLSFQAALPGEAIGLKVYTVPRLIYQASRGFEGVISPSGWHKIWVRLLKRFAWEKKTPSFYICIICNIWKYLSHLGQLVRLCLVNVTRPVGTEGETINM